MDLARLNALPDEEAREVFHDCCASAVWAERMAGRRPFSDSESLLAAARDEWHALDDTDREEAFAAHPRIGEAPTGDDRHSRWSREEQADSGGPDEDIARRLAVCNRAYEARFDRVYLVFATGKTAAEMLAICERRLENDAATEFEIASGEQQKIMELRLRRAIGIG